MAYKLDPISLATEGYVCEENPNDMSIATHGIVCIDGLVILTTRTAAMRYWVGLDINLIGRYDRGG
jgi:hypothetical protein